MAEVTSLKGTQCHRRSVDIYKQQDYYVSLESTFKLPTGSFVTLMSSSPSEKCWIQHDGSNDVNLTDKTGNNMNSLKCDSTITGMDFQNEDKILICAGNHIKHALVSSRKLTSLVCTKTLIPRGLCVSSNGDIYVTLEDEADYSIMQHSERVVIRYSSRGREKARAKYDRQGNPLFVRPNRIKVNSTRDDVIVINYTDHSNSHMVILHADDLTLRLRYLGNGQVVSDEQTFDTMTYTPTTMTNTTNTTSTPTKMTYTPKRKYAVTDIGLDVYDNILVCEFYSRSVQMLTSDCEPMLTILPTQAHTPLLMAVTRSDLWMGFEDGAIHVYSIHTNLEPETLDTQF